MLYKYFAYNENSLSCLLNYELWASKPTEFNDPFDSLLTIEFSNNNITELFKNYTQSKAVCCFSKKMDSILMWSHYADSHKGFCIAIDCQELENSDILSDVNYSDNFLDVDHECFLHSHKEGTVNKEWQRLLTQKYIDWKYEEEVRLILQLVDPQAKGKCFSLPQGSIKEIYFGCKMIDKNKNNIRKIMESKNVTFYDMKKSQNNFKLEKI
ncbi:DUF2971 domain-containing protein [Vibrio parahaemolyticus]|uniref:DUF2971 domain-containing protein n=1 Tax=Vibrio parahaemolyticus TaxID=670 RepID=UPI00310168DE